MTDAEARSDSPWRFRREDTVLAAAAVVVLGLSTLVGLVYNVLIFLLSYAAVVPAVARALPRRRGRYPVLRVTPAFVSHLVVRAGFWAMAGFFVALAMVPMQLGRGTFLVVVGSIVAGTLARTTLACFPDRRGTGATNVACIVGIVLLFAHAIALTTEPTGGVVLDLPLRSPALVVHGGPSPLVNHHFVVRSQRHALDLVMTERGRTSQGDPSRLTSYAAWDEPVVAPARGVVVAAVDRFPDQRIGGSDRDQPAGNHVVIDIGRGRHVLLAHLRQGSVAVRVGETVEVGESIGRIGNSGNTSEPHLHVQLQDAPSLAEAKRTFPIRFRDVRVTRLGRTKIETTHAPRRNDVLQGVG